VATTGDEIVRILVLSVGTTTAVDFTIATALIDPVALNVADTVRVPSFADCAVPLVVTPVPTVT